ncbi:MAG: BamA/TamA family outer membrane protein, partial [Sinobacteraceae bacterium]|nr:BamA/TamA family outer membrane protein [Nevskiaceae bacterium]
MSNRSGVLAWPLLAIAAVLIAAAIPGADGVAWAADPQPYKVELGSTNDGELNATLKATSDLVNLRSTAPVGPFALIGRARGDLDRLKTVLESSGFYQSYVGITIDGLPLDDPGLGEELSARAAGSDAQVKVSFSLGPQYHLRKVEIDGQVPEKAAQALQLNSGAPAIAADVLAAGGRLLQALQDDGFAFARVDPPVAHEFPTERVLDVSFHVTTGKRVNIGEIHLQGLKDMKERIIRRRLLVHSGEPYAASQLEAARKDLLAMGVFSAVSVNLGQPEESAQGVPVTFVFRERKQHAVSLSAAYSSDLGGSTGVNWTKRDISGHADSLTLSATAINLGGGTATNGIGYDVNGKYLIPDFGRRDQSLQVSIGALSQSLIAYNQKAVTFGIALSRKLSNLWTISAGFGAQQEHIVQQECTATQQCAVEPLNLECVLPGALPPDSCLSQSFHYTLLSLPLNVLFNNTGLDSPLQDARKGVRATLSIGPTFSVGHPGTQFFVTQFSASFYFDLQNLHISHDPGRSVVAVRGVAGLAAGASEFSLPPDQRFYAGGSGSIRGYRYQSVGP